MSNTITLLGLGKKVYMRNDVTQFVLFKKLNIEVFEIENLDLEPTNSYLRDQNIEKVKNYFLKKI
jgi:dTDP-N-acetylfucosamine:lipid II N-acetylfucosaminyltransferase